MIGIVCIALQKVLMVVLGVNKEKIMQNLNDISLFRGGSNNTPLINVADPQQASNSDISINPVAVDTSNPDFIPY